MTVPEMIAVQESLRALFSGPYYARFRTLDPAGPDPFLPTEDHVRVFSDAVTRAEIVFWELALERIATDDTSPFHDVPLAADLLPTRPQLWLSSHYWMLDFKRELEEVRDAYQLPSPYDPARLSAYLLIPIPSGVSVVGVWQAHEGTKEGRRSFAPRLRLLLDLFPGESTEGVGVTLHAMLAFTKQRIVTVEPLPVPRGDRRRAEKEGRPEPVVRVVTLRKTERREEVRPEGSEPVDWSCQWLVGAHWRKNHWDTDHPIFVNSYLKGPDDKPFRAPKATIYRVQR